MENYQVADADTPLPTLVGPNNFCVAIRNSAVAAAIADELNRLVAEVERLREERRWRVVAEEPPPPSTIVVAFDGEVFESHYSARCGWTALRDGLPRTPTHWQPLPAPPVEEE